MHEIYHNPKSAQQVENVSAFRRLTRRYEWLEFYQPNPNHAPWLYQTVVRWKSNPNGILINFWPHKCKAQIDGDEVVSGEESVRDLISQAIDASEHVEELQVIE